MSTPTITTQPDLFDSVTYEALTEPVTCPCGHSFNLSTYRDIVSANPVCPTCRGQLSRTPPAINILLRTLVASALGLPSSNSSNSSAAPIVPIAPAPDIKPFRGVRLSVGAEIITRDSRKILHLQVKAPSEGEEEGADYLFGIDKSGSMSGIAWVKVDKGEMGITRLGLVKHMVLTMAAMMTDRDRVAIVSFNDMVTCNMPLTPMNATGKTLLTRTLDGIQADNSTNIWGAVNELAKIANSDACAGRRLVGVLLTDGQPTESIHPVTAGRSTMPMIQERIKVHNPWQFHTVGFSSDINSSLLEQMARWGNGRFLFVPSGDMVSTNGINLIAYEKTVASHGTRIEYTAGGNRYQLETGPVAFGATRDIIVYLPPGATGVEDLVAIQSNSFTIPTGSSDKYLCRYDFVNTLTGIIDDYRAASVNYGGGGSIVADLEKRLNAFYDRYAPSTDPDVQAILRDVRSTTDGEQQCRIALSYMRDGDWGLHYLRAYRDHQNAQICMNFKDPGLKIYETPRFLAHQTAGDVAFAAIPPPPVQRRGHVDYSITVSSAFNNAGGSCFEGSMPVLMDDGTTIPIRNIRRGNRVKGGAVVIHAVEFNSYAPSQPMVQLTQKVAVTPWHPCRVASAASATNSNSVSSSDCWTFPANLVQYAARPLQTVYNLVLSEGHIIEADGYEFVTLGHGFTEAPLAHEFFGTQECVHAIEAQPGAHVGRPVYTNCVAIKENDQIVRWVDQV